MKALFVAAVLLLAAAVQALAAVAGSVVGISGACYVESGTNRTALTLGVALQVGDIVDVPADGRLKLRMADGSIVAVGSGSHFAISTYTVSAAGQRQDAKLSLTQGLLHAIVAPVEPTAKFEVQTGVGTAAVRSTDWLIEATATSQQVSVISGSVAVTSAATGHGVIVPAGHQTHLEAGRDPLPPRPLARTEFARLVSRTEIAAPRGQSHARPPRARPQLRPPHREPPHIEAYPHRMPPEPPRYELQHPLQYPGQQRWREPHYDRDRRPYHPERGGGQYPDHGDGR